MSMYDVELDSFIEPTEEMNRRAKQAMNWTWQTIADDLFSCSGDKSMTRKHIVECVLDANFMETYGGDVEAAKYTIWLKRYHPTKFKELCKNTFSTREYA